MELEDLIRSNYKELTEGEQFIANYVLKNRNLIINLNINELADECLSSKSSILRFCQKLGFEGYTEFKGYIKYSLSDEKNREAPKDIKNQLTEAYTELIDYYLKLDLTEILETIDNAGKIYILGTGREHQIWLEVLKRGFYNYGKIIDTLEYGMNNLLFKNILKELSADDLLIVNSHSGENLVLKDALSLAIIKDMKIFSFTSLGNNWLSNHSTYHISIYPNYLETYPPNCRYLLIDILLYRYEEFQNFKKNNS